MKNNFKKIFRRNISLRLVDFIKKTETVQTFYKLQASQWLTLTELQAIQIEKLRNLLIHAYENVPYYNKLFNEHGFKANRFQNFNELDKLPILTKKKIRENFDFLKARNFRHFSPRPAQTSGSTGEPLRFFRDRSSHSCGWANAWRAFSVAGFCLGDPFVILTGGALMPHTTRLKQRIYVAMMGMRQLPAYHLSVDELESYISFLERITHPTYFYSYASAAYLMARYVLKQGKHLNSFRGIFTTSETLSSNQRETIQEAFGCPVFDTYGNNEASIYAHECELQEGLHYSMEHSFLEVLDEDDRPCKVGETGRFVATNLSNYAMPFIRYDTGDLGSITNSECSCGRGLRKIKNILGRSRDFILTPDGRHIHGAFFNHFEPFYKTPWIAGWHVLQDQVDHIKISLCPDGQPKQVDIENMRALLAKALGEEVKIDFIINMELHTTPAGKQKVIESRILDEASS